MARKTTPELRAANLSFQEMQQAVPKIDRRINDLKSFDVNSIDDRSDARIGALENELDTLLISIFGHDTIEYKKHHHDTDRLDRAPISFGGPTPLHIVRESLARGVASAIANLETIKKGFLEELEDAGLTSSGKTMKAYEGLELHPYIEKAAGQLFRDGYYASAVEDGVKALNALVRLNSGVDDKDGMTLMEHVFSPQNPILKFNELKDATDKDEQKGFMFLFSGSVAGLRNPRAHKIIEDDPEMALEFIAFISLLAKLADKATK